MKDKENIPKIECIDWDNLCNGNDFSKLTNNYDINTTSNLIWSVPDHTQRQYLLKAISLQRKRDDCKKDDPETWFAILSEQIELQKNYESLTLDSIKQSNTPTVIEKPKRYNTRQSAVLMYFICDKMGVHFCNSDNTNCTQKAVTEVLSKTFGWDVTSYNDMLNLKFSESATRKAMLTVANDYKDVLPEMSEEIMRVYDDYEDDATDLQKAKKKLNNLKI